MVLDGKGSEEYPLNAEVPQSSILGLTFFLLHINDLPDDVMCDIAIYADNTTLYFKCDQASDLWQQLNWLLNLNLIYETVWTGVRSDLLISLLVSFGFIWPVYWQWFYWFENGWVSSRGNFKLHGLTFCSKLDWGSYIISIAMTASKKIGALICSMNFLSLEVVLNLYNSPICPCMKYYCHVWASAPSC